VTESSNEIFNFGNISLLGFVLTPLDHVLIASGLDVGIVVTTVVTQLFVGHIQSHDIGADIVHEIL